MYKYASGQIRFEDFGQPVGMHMSPNNRWVKRAESIPWDEIEYRYAKLFKNRKGNVAKPLRLALGACIIQSEYGFSDEETVLQIQEGPYLQFFCGFPQYEANLSFCKERGIRLSGPALGRPKKDTAVDRKLEYTGICDWVEVERKFSLAKRKCGLGLIMTKLRITTEHVVAMSILLLNLRKVLSAFLRSLFDWMFLPYTIKNWPLFS